MSTYVFTTRDLKALNAIAVDNGYSRSLSDAGVALLHPDGLHVAGFTMVHNDDHLRVEVLTKMIHTTEPVRVFIDMPFGDIETYSTTVKVS